MPFIYIIFGVIIGWILSNWRLFAGDNRLVQFLQQQLSDKEIQLSAAQKRELSIVGALAERDAALNQLTASRQAFDRIKGRE